MPSSNSEDLLSKPYIPIDTDLVDNIHHYSSDRMHVNIEYKDRSGTLHSMRGYIADVYTTKSHEEFLKMEDGRTLRLDQLVRVDPTGNGDVKPMERDRTIELEERLDIKVSKFFPNGIN